MAGGSKADFSEEDTLGKPWHKGEVEKGQEGIPVGKTANTKAGQWEFQGLLEEAPRLERNDRHESMKRRHVLEKVVGSGVEAP